MVLWDHTEYSCCKVSPLNVSAVHAERLCLALEKAVLHSGHAAEFSLGLDTIMTAACHSYCREGRASALESTALGSLLPMVVNRVRAGGRDVSTLGVSCDSKLSGTPGSSTQTGLHLLLVWAILLNPLIHWRSQGYFTTDDQSISKSSCRAHSGTYDQIFLPVGMLLSESCGLVSLGRHLWREDVSAICGAIS
jgi:hypothetical protein